MFIRFKYYKFCFTVLVLIKFWPSVSKPNFCDNKFVSSDEWHTYVTGNTHQNGVEAKIIGKVWDNAERFNHRFVHMNQNKETFFHSGQVLALKF